MAEKVTMVIDCDTGVDDAVAIMMALSQPNVDVMAITCVSGNAALDKVTVNVLRVLKKCNRLDIPVFAGATDNLIGGSHDASCAHGDDASCAHGDDGLGDVPNAEEPPSLDILQSEHAVQALIRMANEKPGLITVFAIGPLTNIGLAMRMDPTFSSKLKEMVIMGGNMHANGTGFSASEFNFGIDPEAAHIVVKETMCPTIVVPLETCMSHAVSFEWFDELSRNEKPRAQFIAAITKNAVEQSQNFKRPAYMIADGCAMVVAAHRDAVRESTHSPCSVELQGTMTRGQLILISTPWVPTILGPKIELVTQFDMELFYKMLNDAVK